MRTNTVKVFKGINGYRFKMKQKKIYLSLGAGIVLFAAFFLYQRLASYGARTPLVLEWLRAPQAHPDWVVQADQRCPSAPFHLPTSGFIGYLWDDSFEIGQRHTGLDIFNGTTGGTTPVVAAYDGYITRSVYWKSALIQRIPSDPLHPGQQIWLYYTHMADTEGNSYIAEDFPPGTVEVFVKAGTLLGYQGDYAGENAKPISVHLHFSIVKDDGEGNYLSETDIHNTIDPSPYFALPLNAQEDADAIPVCSAMITPSEPTQNSYPKKDP